MGRQSEAAAVVAVTGGVGVKDVEKKVPRFEADHDVVTCFVRGWVVGSLLTSGVFPRRIIDIVQSSGADKAAH